MSYTGHLELLTVRVTSPIRRKAWWISDHQRSGIARTMGDGEWSGTQRELMELLGYSSTGGVQRWLRTLYRGGIAKVYTARGWAGRTRIRFVKGVIAVSTKSMYAHVTGGYEVEEERLRTLPQTGGMRLLAETIGTAGMTDLAHLSIEELTALDLCECGRKLSTHPETPKLVWRSWQARRQHDESKVAENIVVVPWSIKSRPLTDNQQKWKSTGMPLREPKP